MKKLHLLAIEADADITDENLVALMEGVGLKVWEQVDDAPITTASLVGSGIDLALECGNCKSDAWIEIQLSSHRWELTNVLTDEVLVFTGGFEWGEDSFANSLMCQNCGARALVPQGMTKDYS